MAEFEITSSNGRLSLAGDFRLSDAASIWRELRRDERSITGPLTIDLARARIVDGGILALLVALRRELAARGITSEITGASERLLPLLHLPLLLLRCL